MTVARQPDVAVVLHQRDSKRSRGAGDDCPTGRYGDDWCRLSSCA
jgi:hypothetical protein